MNGLSLNRPRYLVIANPDSKRWQTYAHDLAGFWQERGLRPDIHLLPWREVVPRGGRIDDLPGIQQPALLRLESPGRDFEVAKLLLLAGDPCGPWLDLSYRKGQLVAPNLFYRGFCRVLQGLRRSLDARPKLRPLACPLAIAEMFDKRATAERLRAAGIPCPPTLPAPPAPGPLLEYLRAHRISTAYVKLNTGSSASGIAVVHALDDAPWAISTVIRLDGGFFSTRRLRRVSGSDLEATLEFLFREDAIVQEGIPMAQIDGQNFDVRIVMLHGRPAFTVFRLSGQPMTNLHLGGRRGCPTACLAHIPTRAWLDALDHCVAAAGIYPCASLGIDLLFERGYVRHYLLEINAFGDFFPGLVDESGRTIHRAEIEATARKFGLVGVLPH
jgi:glutathione synthase/RimK-type ligase-like ATP-grasp enzyme